MKMDNDLPIMASHIKPKNLKRLSSTENVILFFYCQSINLANITLSFPPRPNDETERRIQQMNYDYFINTMAEIMKKYMPNIETKED